MHLCLVVATCATVTVTGLCRSYQPLSASSCRCLTGAKYTSVAGELLFSDVNSTRLVAVRVLIPKSLPNCNFDNGHSVHHNHSTRIIGVVCSQVTW